MEVIDVPKGVKGTGKAYLEERRKKVKIPKSGELVKTSDELCSYCKYSAYMMGCSLRVCEYVIRKHEPRGCKIGECNKFELLVEKRKKILPN